MDLTHESNLQRRLEENRRGKSQESYYAAIDRLTGKKSAPRTPAFEYKAPGFDAEPPPQPDRWSVGGFAENVLNDAFGLLKGLYQIIPTAAKGAYDVFSDPKGIALLFDNPEHLVSAFGDTAAAVKDAILEPYQKHGVGVLYHRPVTAVLDALAINGLIAGGVKAAGRVAGNQALLRAGIKLEHLPSDLARAGIDKAVLKATGGKWDLAKRREYLHLKAEEAAQIPLKIAKDYKDVGQKVAALADDEALLWDKWRKMGYSNEDAAAHPKVAEALESYRKLAAEWHEGLKARGLLDDARAEGALVKKYAAEAFKNLDEPSMVAAREAIFGTQPRPSNTILVYHATPHDIKGEFSLGRVGTGEGNAAFGHGGYFAEAKSVSEVYKKRFGDKAKIYEFEISDTNKFLEWDKPLREQPKVIELLKRAGIPFDENALGKVFYEQFGKSLHTPFKVEDLQRVASEKLKSIGVGGIKYFDADSRVAGKGTRNFVVFDERLIKKPPTTRGVENKPVYGPAMFERKFDSLGEMIDRFIDMSRTSKGGRTNFLEEYTGKEGAITDPRKYVPEAIKNFRNVEGRLRFDESVIQNFGDAAAIRGEKLPMGVNRKHFDDTMRERAFDSIQDPTIKRLLKLERNIAGDPARVVLGIYDRMLNLWRSAATAWNPAYYMGNAVGDAVFSVLAGSDFAKAQKFIREGAMPPQAMAKVGMAPGGFIEKARDIANSADAAARAGIITRRVAKEIAENAAHFEKAGYTLDSILRSTQQLSDTRVQLQLLQEHVARTDRRVQKADSVINALLQKEKRLAARIEKAGVMAPGSPQVEALNAARQRIVNLTKVRDDMVRDLADSAMKESNLEARIPGLKEQNDVVRKGVTYANDYIGNYMGMDGFEQGVMRRLIPFYPFVKAMNMLAFKLPFINPVKTFLWHRYSMAAWSMIGDPEMPEWTKGYVPVFARANGDMVWVRLSRYSPFESLRATKFGDVPIPSGASPEQNPFIGLAIKYMGGKTIFDKTGLPYGEPMVNISNGDVYEFSEDGKLRKTIPQTPLVSGLMHFFPISQLIEDVLTPYVVNKYNWVGFPEPKLNPDGSYRYPREALERMSALVGVKTMIRGKENIKQAERSKVDQAIRNYISVYRRSTDPEEKQLIEKVLQDYKNGEYRRIGQ